MTEVDKNKIEEEILKTKFNFEKFGFYDPMELTDTDVGFSFKKDFKDIKDHVSLFHLLIPNNSFRDTRIKRKPILVTVVYGKKTDYGVSMRQLESSKLSEPIDLNFTDEFFYDIDTKKFYKGNKEIEAEDILKEVYEKHIKPSRYFIGFFLRLKFRFWRFVLPSIFSFISKIFHYFLLVISGDRYSYEFLFEEENLNGEIISSKSDLRMERQMRNQTAAGKEKEKEAKKIEFFGIDVPKWPIVFYSILHLSIYAFLKYFGCSTTAIEDFLNNSFLVVLYVIVSFWIVETILPIILKWFVRFFSTLSARSLYKNLSV